VSRVLIMSPRRQIVLAALLLATASAWAGRRRPRPKATPVRPVVGLSMTPDQVVDAVQQAVADPASVGPAGIMDAALTNIGDSETEAAILNDLSGVTEDLLMVSLQTECVSGGVVRLERKSDRK